MLITPVLQGEAEARRGSLACQGGREESRRLRPPLSASALYFAAVLPPEASLAPSSHLERLLIKLKITCLGLI